MATAAPPPPLTADDGADEGGVPRAVDQRELELAGPRAQLRREGGAQAGEAQVQRDAPRPALRRPVEGGGGAGGAQRPRQRRLPAVDVAQDAHVHVEDAGRRGPGGHDGAAPGRSLPTAPLRQRGPRRRRSALPRPPPQPPGGGKTRRCPAGLTVGRNAKPERNAASPPPPRVGQLRHAARAPASLHAWEHAKIHAKRLASTAGTPRGDPGRQKSGQSHLQRIFGSDENSQTPDKRPWLTSQHLLAGILHHPGAASARPSGPGLLI